MTIRRMLAITHETTLTGAPMNLLHFLRWVGANTDTRVDVIAMGDGPLRQRFEQVADVTVLDRGPVARAFGTAHIGLTHLGSTRAWRPFAWGHLRPQLRHLGGYDLVYANSLQSSTLLPYLPPSRMVVSHVHELQVALRTWKRPEQVAALTEIPDAWIAASGAVRDMLVDERGFDPDKVLLHHEFIDARRISERRISVREVERLRRELDIPADAAVVVGAGTIDWRKGPDQFIQLAAEMRRRTRDPLRFVWVGGELEGTDWERLRSDIERTGSDHVRFAGTVEDPLPYFAMGDVFVLTSREDPFPLVCLENAAMCTPIVTFRNGGMPELLEAAGPESASGVVDHLDTVAMANRVLALLDSDRLTRTVGDQLRARVLEHHDVETSAPRLYRDLGDRVDGLR